MSTVSYAERVRQQLSKRAEEKSKNQANYDSPLKGLEFKPEVGTTTKVRILPPADTDDPFFYRTHSYHYLEGVGPVKEGKATDVMLFTKKQYDVDGEIVKCPIDEATKELYASGDQENKNIYSKIKRKRHFYFNVLLVDEPDPEKKFAVMIDTSNDGKLAKKICSIMGIPFCRDTEDEWFPKNQNAQEDEDRQLFDLLDFDNGHDLKIVKSKDGNQAWDISYDNTFPVSKPRALTKEERKIAEKRMDLTSLVTYESNFEKINEFLSKYLDNLSKKESSGKIQKKTNNLDNIKVEDDSDEEVVKPKKKDKIVKKQSKDIEESEYDDLMDQLEEE